MCQSQSSHGHVPRISLEPDSTARGGPMATWQGPRLASVTWRLSPTIPLVPHTFRWRRTRTESPCNGATSASSADWALELSRDLTLEHRGSELRTP
jgi:hypothetical protein